MIEHLSGTFNGFSLLLALIITAISAYAHRKGW